MRMMPIELFDFAYIPDWHDQIRFLSKMALGEPWTFRFPPQENLRRENFILEKYVSAVFRNQSMQAQAIELTADADKYFYIRDGFACFNTGLVTKRYKAIFAYFEKNVNGHQRSWWLRGFYDDTSPQLRKIENLPLKPFFDLRPELWGFSPNLPIRVNIDHILDKPENMLRIPEAIRGFPNLYMLLQTGVEMARRTAELIPSIDSVSSWLTEKVEWFKGLFNFTWKLPEFKLPRIHVEWNDIGWGIKLPKLSVAWNALGGIFDRPTIFATAAGLQGVGEAGPEAILPLGTLWDEMSDRLKSGMTDILREMNLADSDTMAEAVRQAVHDELAGLAGKQNVPESGTNGETALYLQVDGKTFARLILPYMDKEQAATWQRNLQLSGI